MTLHPRLHEITERIRERSRPTRQAYLDGIAAVHANGPQRRRLSCGNLAHAFAASGATDKGRLKADATPNLGIVSAYNDMLSAHQPFEDYPALIRETARALGATAQVAGGVPAMCDGVTQGRPGMELSLFSRDVIAQATAISLSHDMFDAALYLGVCDKIVPGLLIGALAFGHLPAVFVPAGPMTPGIPNKLKAEVRERYAAGEATREELLEAESGSYHAPGTCTFYGTANSNQVMLEAMGLQLPGTSFVNPGTPLRTALTRAAAERALRITALGGDYRPIGQLVDERCIVNAIVALIATGGSTNHTIHFVAVARAAGIALTWDDIDDLSQAVPLLARVYPNGEADVNRFAAAGGTQFVFRELLDAGLMHDDLPTIVPGGMRAYTDEPRIDGDTLAYAPGAAQSGDDAVVRTVAAPFEAHGGLRLLQGNLGRALIKLSAIKPEYRSITAPAVVVDNPQALEQAARRRRPAAGFRRGRALPGAARQRHAGDAFADAAARHAAEPGPSRRAGHRRTPVRRVGQDPVRHPRHAGGRARRCAGATARRRHHPPRRRARRARSAGRCRRMERAQPRRRHHAAGLGPGPQPVRQQPRDGHARRPGRVVDFVRTAAAAAQCRAGIRCGIRTRQWRGGRRCAA